eukprot:scpid53624/ scgid26647/ 
MSASGEASTQAGAAPAPSPSTGSTRSAASDVHEQVSAQRRAERPFRELLDCYRLELIDKLEWEAVLDYLLSDPNNGVHHGDQTERISRANHDRRSRRYLLDAVMSRELDTFRSFVRGLARPEANPRLAQRIAEDADAQLDLKPPLLSQVREITESGASTAKGSRPSTSSNDGQASSTAVSTSSTTTTNITGSVLPPHQTLPPLPVAGSMSQAGLTYLPQVPVDPASDVDGHPLSSSLLITTVAELESEQSVSIRQMSTAESQLGENSPVVELDRAVSTSSEVCSVPVQVESDTVEPRAPVSVGPHPTIIACEESRNEAAERSSEHAEPDLVADVGDTDYPYDNNTSDNVDCRQLPSPPPSPPIPPSPYAALPSPELEPAPEPAAKPATEPPAAAATEPAADGYVPWYSSRSFPAIAISGLGLTCLLLAPADRAQHIVILTGIVVACSLVMQYHP